MNRSATITAGRIIDRALAAMGTMATLPEVSAKVLRIVNSPTGSAHDLHELIRHDPALSALVLKAVNSAFYGFPGQIASLDRAIILLGFSAVRNIALTPGLSRVFGRGSDAGPFPPRALWQHSVAVGLAAKALAGFQRRSVDPDEMFLIGLVHDLGLVVERQAFPAELAEVARRHADGAQGLLALEEEVIGASHQELGEALMAKWRFPRSLRTIVSHHHDPEHLPDEHRPAGHLLRVAELVAGEIGAGAGPSEEGEASLERALAPARVEVAQFEAVKERLPLDVCEAVALFGWNGTVAA